jgi:DnaJ family protein C protein 9
MPKAKGAKAPKVEEESKSQSVDEVEQVSTTLLYDILNVPKTATPDEIKKAYRKLALLKHPDKNPDDPTAAENFQKLSKAYQILSNPKKRQTYDQFGEDGEDDFNSTEWLSAYEYYRAMHPLISKDDYKGFAAKYRGSDEESQDLLDFYAENEGDISNIILSIMCCVNDDAPRFVKFFEDKIAAGDIKHFVKMFNKTKTKIQLLADERKEAKAEKAKLKQKLEKPSGSMEDLEKMILAKRENAFGGFLGYMENKYGEK